MPPISRSLPMPAPFARSVAVAALLGATMLASPLSAARAADGVTQVAQAAMPPAAMPPAAAPAPTSGMTQGSADQGSASQQEKAQAAAGATHGKSETVDQRISDLHTALKITSAEEPKWNAVAQAMRENAESIDKIATEAQAKPARNTSAVEDLRLYQRFAEAHVTSLKNLSASFTALYKAMPEAQQKNADQVFAASREQHQQATAANAASHG